MATAHKPGVTGQQLLQLLLGKEQGTFGHLYFN